MNHQSSFSLRSFFQPVDLTQGTCWKTLLVFAFPIIVSYLLQQVYSISDAGHCRSDADGERGSLV